MWGQFANEVLFDDDRERVRLHAENLRYDIDRPHRVVLVRARADRDVLLDAVRQALGHLAAVTLCTTSDTDVVVLGAPDLDWYGLHRDVERIIGPSLLIATSSLADTGEKLVGSLREAEAAMRLGTAVGQSHVIHFDDLGIYRLIAINADEAELERYVDRWLGPVLAYDEAHDGELVRTLSVYLEAGGSLHQATRSSTCTAAPSSTG